MCTANSFALSLFMPKFVCLAAMRVSRACLMPRRHRDASAMRPSTDSYANDIMRRFQFREPGTGSATGLVSGSVQGGSSWLTLIWQNFCMSFCHFVIFRREGEGSEEWGREGHKFEPASASWNAAKFCHFRSVSADQALYVMGVWEWTDASHLAESGEECDRRRGEGGGEE